MGGGRLTGGRLGAPQTGRLTWIGAEIAIRFPMRCGMPVSWIPGLPIEPPFDGQMGRVCITEILQRGSADPPGSRSRGRSSAIALTPPPISRIASREGA